MATWTVDIELVPGWNSILVRAIDNAGNITEKIIVLYYSVYNYIVLNDVLRKSKLISDQYDMSDELDHFPQKIDYDIRQVESDVTNILRQRFDLPFSSVPDIIKYTVTEACVYWILYDSLSDEAPNKNEWFDEYKKALEKIRMIANGNISIYDEAGELIENKTDYISGIRSSDSNIDPIFINNIITRDDDNSIEYIEFRD